METIKPRKLSHSGKKRAYPSIFLWDCLKCGNWNTWQTKRIFGKVNVMCSECREEYILNKSEPLEEITRTKKSGSILD